MIKLLFTKLGQVQKFLLQELKLWSLLRKGFDTHSLAFKRYEKKLKF